MIDYRFPDTAVWHKAMYLEDNEVMRATVNKVEFNCVEYVLKGKGKSQRADGIMSYETRLGLKTNDEIAEEFNADDKIIFKGQTYFIDRVEPLRSNAFLGAKEYVIYLK